MKYFAVHYQYGDDSGEVARVRPGHRQWLATLLDAGRLVGSGPYADDAGGALIIIRLPGTATAVDAAELMDADPFTREGVLAGREIREWNPVINVFRAPEES